MTPNNSFYINYEECKWSFTFLYIFSFPWFYINYEECKFGITSFEALTSKSFILTMRNVNKSYQQELRDISQVLY